jgi:hypothetical protein
MSSCFSRRLRVPIAMRAFYKSCLWILQTLLLKHPDLHPGLLGGTTSPAQQETCTTEEAKVVPAPVVMHFIDIYAISKK